MSKLDERPWTFNTEHPLYSEAQERALTAYGLECREEDALFTVALMQTLAGQANAEWARLRQDEVPSRLEFVPFLCLQMAQFEHSRGRADGEAVVATWRDAMLRMADPEGYKAAYLEWVKSTGGPPAAPWRVVFPDSPEGIEQRQRAAEAIQFLGNGTVQRGPLVIDRDQIHEVTDYS